MCYPHVMRYIFNHMPRRYARALAIPTKVSIEQHCSKQNLALRSEHLPHGAMLHWVGTGTATSSNVLLYFHGGGYNAPINPKGHIGFGLKMANAAGASLAFLEYSLAPKATYPIQLQQAAAALSHLLTTYAASNIIVSGDSAGAHLATGLLSHLNHPSEKIEAVNLSGKLGGFCFISPFTSFDYNKKSYHENKDYDFLTLGAVEFFNSAFKPKGMSDSEAINDPYLSPGDAPVGWWENAPAERLMMLLGTWEVFADDCLALGRRMQEEAGKTSDVKVVECARELHVGAVIDVGFDLEERDMAKAILSWMAQFG